MLNKPELDNKKITLNWEIAEKDHIMPISEGLQKRGWSDKNQLPYQYLNYFFKFTADWTNFFEKKIDQNDIDIEFLKTFNSTCFVDGVGGSVNKFKNISDAIASDFKKIIVDIEIVHNDSNAVLADINRDIELVFFKKVEFNTAIFSVGLNCKNLVISCKNDGIFNFNRMEDTTEFIKTENRNINLTFKDFAYLETDSVKIMDSFFYGKNINYDGITKFVAE